MSSGLPQTDTPAIVACTISRDVQNFDLLIEDMEAALGEAWGDLGFSEALAFFAQPEAETLQFVAMAMDAQDEDDLTLMGEIIAQAHAKEIKVILIAEDVTPAALHSLLRQGADEFIPYPLPEQELQAAIDRLNAEDKPPEPDTNPHQLKSGSRREGALIACHGLAGGTGSTTLAVNLAWELAELSKSKEPRVCLLDFDMQYGSVSTYLDLPRREVVMEMLSETESLDEEVFGQALLPFQDKLQVLTAPSDMIPLEIITPEDVERVIEMARSHFDFVVVDLPHTLVQWSETILHMAHVYFAMIELDMRSAQNTLRLKRALQSEGLPFDKLRFALNRAPKFTDLSGKSRVKRMADSLGISIELLLPDGGKPVLQSCDHGLPLALSNPKNPLRKEIAKLAQSLHELGQAEADAAA
ncbi:AAA family ATPase [Phaeobacter gallaeciensis]|uniref:AAA family ATPase n=1 Tax=Phaeobacter gallaeciensis TaxID=60890 RepID=UPI00237F68F6|nr:AAA family ATPase [Phaeobacter gallaeciensis]MDE4302428.1 AAA family ATPase [Phaeobacter gallaeciensis]MDE4306594.1 AAA family ATPase [Phaeobacter gallaeciensis]MDE4311287.1 AAA family ATPase [Phaeobacter gallaeciensis]MDE4315750.1 AAA family ATPase [Phaeobacter gallaeciensis]MDE4320214.1 AAA family ATPase [Phaeobacter gallaeciensis]